MVSAVVPWRTPRSAYVHIPFCAHQCSYCDFAVAVGQAHQRELYLDALAAELRTLGTPRPVQTVFIGGGTPSELTPEQLQRLLALLAEWLPGPWAECTLEANPDSLDAERCAVLAAHGVTRISLGVQSTQAHLLRQLERQHTPANVPTAIAAVRAAKLHLSLDLIFAVPTQTLSEWHTDLTQAIAWQPEHLSTYGLTFEKGTRLWKAQQRGQVQSADEELERSMYLAAQDILSVYGYTHYEISNFARPGYECQHNETYWANWAYYGFGLGAAAYINEVRTLNTRNLQEYLKRCLAGDSPIFQREELPALERAHETIYQQLRRHRGVQRAEFAQQTGFVWDELTAHTAAPLLAAGLLTDDGTSIALTRAGRCVADAVIAALW
jgi:oxygen-independent coproporphyrinogen-3 oxidase